MYCENLQQAIGNTNIYYVSMVCNKTPSHFLNTEGFFFLIVTNIISLCEG